MPLRFGKLLFSLLFIFSNYGFSQQSTLLLSPAAPLSNDDPCNAIVLPVNINCTLSTYTNAGATATTGLLDPSCGSYFGGDVWFSIIVPASGIVEISSASGTITDCACAAYTGTCNGALTEIGCDDDGGPGLMPQLTFAGLTPGSILFIRFWDYGNSFSGTFQICAIDLCANGSAPFNDLPCNAEPIQLNVYTQGSTTLCATGLNEPLPGSCWINGAINTVWYSVVAASTSLRIRCNPITMSDPQIALYGGSCGPSLTELGCNDDGPVCGSFSPYSDLTVTGLISGATYYLVVDGVDDDIGSFNLLVIDGTQPLPPIPGQDCGTFQPVCGQSFTVGNPGFTGVGNICDFNGSGICLSAGERGSAWYEFTISANGILQFNIVPNDWSGIPSLASTDYDFALWKTAGAGAVNCAGIAAGAAPIRCNFSFLGITGIYGAIAGISPPAYPGFGLAYDSQLNVFAGEKYVLVVSNYSTSTSGFNLNFSGASPIAYGIGSDSTVYWSGSVNTDWFNIANWGGCAIPSCGISAVISGGISNQPVVNGSATCQSLTINPGATLTMQAGDTLTLCGDYVNNGSLNANAGAQVILNNGSVLQNLGGDMIGSNALPNLKINKMGSSVILKQHLDLKGYLNIMNATSVFNVGTKTVKIAGDFINNAGGTYTNAVPGLLEFNGINTQWYYNSNGILPNVRMNNKTVLGLELQNSLTINSLGKLTLDSGIIVNNGFEVVVLNRDPSALTTGNPTSYVYGSLRRYLNPTGSYDFPVGFITKGFQRTNINFAYPAFPTSIDNLSANFLTYGIPAPLGVTDCGVTFSNPGLNNGYWTFIPNANGTTGKFDLTLFNQNYTNAATSNGWTIMSNDGSGWALGNGSCVPSPVTAVQRVGMSGVLNFATAQSPSVPLPVKWLYFNAQVIANNILLHWATASEENNNGFEIYRSIDQNNFEKIGWVDGHGNSNVINTYDYEDKSAKAGINYYYRLHQVDFNGNFEQSKIVTAKLNYQAITINPNPVLHQAVISFYADSRNVRLDIIHPTGELVRTLINGVDTDGNQTYVLEPEKLSLTSGCYILRLIADDTVSHISFCYIR